MTTTEFEPGIDEIVNEIIHSCDGLTNVDREPRDAVLGRCAVEAQFARWDIQHPNIHRALE